MNAHHILPFGAELQAGGTKFRLWAPDVRRVSLLTRSHDEGCVQTELERQTDGWHELTVAGMNAGALYKYRIGEFDVPDPGARFAPRGLYGCAEVIDPGAFQWRDLQWRGRPWHEAVVYELHVGTFTPAGTFAAIIPRLAELAELGITAIELLPVATFPGMRGWGYDGVLPFAPHPAYGRPEDLKRLIQTAHDLRLMVLLDVVYNHFGPEGNFLAHYARDFFNPEVRTPWGDAINFKANAAFNARSFFIENALYWLNEYRFDGLRLDAVHAMHDDNDPHFVDELAEALESGPGRERHVHLILENHANQARRLRVKAGSQLSKSQWNDDFHHPLHVLLTGESDGYYVDYASRPLQHLGRALAQGFAFQGEPFSFDNDKPRGEPSADLPATAFIHFLQNHDQIGNRAGGERLAQITPPQRLRAAFAVLLLAPQPPMLFMGEEYAAHQPFLYFCDYQGELARAITDGRRAEFAAFQRFADATAVERIADPNDKASFVASQLAWSERHLQPHRSWLAYTHELLQLRQRHIVPFIPRILSACCVYDVSETLLQVQWPMQHGARLVLRANLGDARVEPSIHCQGALLFSTVSRPAMGTEPLAPWEVQLLLA